MDLRVEKTLIALKEALASLLEEKDFGKITVNDICQKANVRRTTFYLHYADKYDFMKQVMEEWFADLFKEGKEDDEEETFNGYFLELLKRSLRSVDKKRDKIRLLSKGNTYLFLDDTLKKSVMELLQSDLEKRLPSMKENERELVVTAYASVYSALLAYFVSHEEETSANMESQIDRFLKDYRQNVMSDNYS